MRVLVLGIDGMTFRVLDPLIEKGYLPNFKSLKEEGSWGILESTIPPVTGPAWMTMATGLPTSSHGVFGFWDYTADMQPRMVTRRKAGKAIWEILSEAGKKVCVINVPLTYPPDPVNGLMISGFTTPSLDAPFVYPKDFQARLFEISPHYVIDVADPVLRFDKEKFLSFIVSMSQARYALVEHFLDQKRDVWDFMFVVFVGPDRIQHVLWEELQNHDPAVVEYYTLLDRLVGQIVDKLDQNDLLFIVSDHGFKGIEHVFFLDQWLYEQGFINVKKDKGYYGTVLKKRMASFLSRIGLETIRQTVSKYVSRNRDLWSMVIGGGIDPYVDVKHSLAFGIDAASGSHIRVWVEDEQVQKQVVGQIGNDLPHLATYLEVLPETVWGEGAYHLANNMLLRLLDSYMFSTGLSFDRAIYQLPKIQGIHAMDGVFMAYGRDIVPGMLKEAVSIFDITPTITHCFGLPVESTWPGEARRDITRNDQAIRIRDSHTGAVYSLEDGLQQRSKTALLLRKLLAQGDEDA